MTATWFMVLIFVYGSGSGHTTVMPQAYPSEEACIAAFVRRSNRDDGYVEKNLHFTCIAGLEKKP